jgi:hypothetical protein
MHARSQKVWAKSGNARKRVLWMCTISLVLCMSAIRPLNGRSANYYTEIMVELNSTWRSPTLTNHHSVVATCIVGSNDWYFSGDFTQNARVDFWLIGTNVVEYSTITSSMYVEQAREYVGEKILGEKPHTVALSSYPRAGETFTTIHPSPLGQPVFSGMGGVVWLAFCSGDYLKQPDRQIPMPIGPSSDAFGYADKTAAFDDPFGLPKSVKLFATNGTLTCEYEVLAATNFLGRTFPLNFRVSQLGQPADGAARFTNSATHLEGQVLSIKPGKGRELPDEVRQKLQE